MQNLWSKEHLFSLLSLSKCIFAHLYQNRRISASTQTDQNLFLLQLHFHAYAGFKFVFRHFGETAIAECFIARSNCAFFFAFETELLGRLLLLFREFLTTGITGCHFILLK